jgi:hypothetical protein
MDDAESSSFLVPRMKLIRLFHIPGEKITDTANRAAQAMRTRNPNFVHRDDGRAFFPCFTGTCFVSRRWRMDEDCGLHKAYSALFDNEQQGY